jgi:hypothetical protein
MKKQLLFIALCITSFINAQSMEFTSAELTTAEVGSTVTINYEYTSTVSAQVYCALEKHDGTTSSTTVADAFLSPLPAGTDLTGSFALFIPSDTELTADLTGDFIYKIKIEMKTEGGADWLAGDYPTTEINLVASTNTNSITITSPIANAEVESTITVNFKYTSDNASNYIYCGLNLYDDTTWESFVAGEEFTSAPAGTDMTGSITITIPAGTALTSDLTGLDNYKLGIEMREDVGFSLLADEFPTAETNIVAPGTLSITSFEEAFNKIAVYPNPTKNSLQIINFSRLKNPSIKIFNLLGKEVLSTLNSTEIIDVSSLVNGIYLLSIKTEKNTKTIKFVKN